MWSSSVELYCEALTEYSDFPFEAHIQTTATCWLFSWHADLENKGSHFFCMIVAKILIIQRAATITLQQI